MELLRSESTFKRYKLCPIYTEAVAR